MVKNGEIYSSTNPASDSSRPWNLFNPSTNFCGLLTYVQDYILWDLKSVCPYFSHGDNGTTLKDRIEQQFKGYDKNDYYSLSLDGSAFDSNQHFEIMQMVDFKFYDLYESWLEKIVDSILLNLSLDPRTRIQIMEGLKY